MTTTPSLSDDEIEERFFLLGRMEILNVLNDLIHRRETVTVYFNGGSEFFVTTLLEAGQNGLIFDLSGDDRANRRLPSSRSCVFVGRLHGIRVQFSSGRAEAISWGGSNAFHADLPERVVRLQRRESYRILLPAAKPLLAKLCHQGGKALAEWAAHDISVGGVGLNVLGVPPVEVDQQLLLDLTLTPKVRIRCIACVRHVTRISEQQDGGRHRVGLCFVGVEPSLAVAIQRYIVRIEHERRGMLNLPSFVRKR